MHARAPSCVRRFTKAYPGRRGAPFGHRRFAGKNTKKLYRADGIALHNQRRAESWPMTDAGRFLMRTVVSGLPSQPGCPRRATREAASQASGPSRAIESLAKYGLHGDVLFPRWWLYRSKFLAKLWTFAAEMLRSLLSFQKLVWIWTNGLESNISRKSVASCGCRKFTKAYPDLLGSDCCFAGNQSRKSKEPLYPRLLTHDIVVSWSKSLGRFRMIRVVSSLLPPRSGLGWRGGVRGGVTQPLSPWDSVPVAVPLELLVQLP
mmetsp:Transcript_53509/g.120603  ORF Transcript_53509/g.120603 Transcript_53509/m.120603 type:complete len:262 (-) Transcript_53509:332-1117(-)